MNLTRVLLVVLVLLVVVPATADEWYEHYARAERALKNGDHTTAVAELNQAIERRGNSGVRVRTYGMRVVDYFPYLQLGIAYFAAGEHEAALRSFDTEEQLGAVRQSGTALAELESYRREAGAALDRRREERQREIDDLVAENLADADDHRRAGRLEDALAATDRALALEPENREAIELADALRNEVAQRDEERRRVELAARLKDEGRRLRADGKPAEAAARFRQAAELVPGSEAGELLREVQAQLASLVEAEPVVDSTADLIEAEALIARGDLEAALAAVQRALALDPANDRAGVLEAQLLADIAETRHSSELDRLMGEAESRLTAGDPEDALAAANLVLAADRGHAGALDVIRRAYTELGQRLLGEGPIANLPPAIRFAVAQELGPSGEVGLVVSESDFRMSGVVIDESEVELVVTGARGTSLPIELSSQHVGGVTITEFRIEVELKPGSTTIVVDAIDTEGLSSRSEVTVDYRRPLLRSPWLWGGLIAAVFLVAIVRWIGTRRRRAELRRRRFNPYIAGPPVLDPGLFVGRDALVDRVLATVPNNSLLLLGERRIGKTSTLQQLRRRLPDLDHPRFCFVPVSVDLQGVAEEAFFATVAEAVGEVVGDTKMSAARVADGYDSRELMRDLRRVLPTVECPDGRQAKVVLLLDEIDELNGYSHRTNQRLRSLFMRSFADRLVAVAAGVGIAREWDHEGSPWYNFFEELEVGPVDTAAARRLVTEPLAGVITIDDEAVNRLLENADGRPYILQKSALAAVQRVHEDGRSRITVEDID